MPFPDYEPSVPHFLRDIVSRHGDRTLVVLDDRRITFAEAEAQSARLARGLLARGVGKGSRVGLLMPNGPDWVVCCLAATRIGALCVPLNTFSQTRELAWILRHADVDTLLCVSSFLSHDYLARLEEAAPGLASSGASPLRLPALPFLRSVLVWGESDRAWAQSGPELIRSAGDDSGGQSPIDDEFLRATESAVSPADAMMLLYSSGSTADPKGALHSHASVIRHSFNLVSVRDLTSEDRAWSPMPFFWVGGLVYALLGNMHVGAATLCEEVFEPGKTLAFLARERATVALGWPHFGIALAQHPERDQHDLSSLRAGNMPGLLPKEMVHPDPELRVNALGMTETCGPHTWSLGDPILPERLRGSFGTPVAGVEHKVVDPDSGQELPAGEFGEICVRGYSLMMGLYKKAREDVFDPDGFYRTGDGGYFDPDGVLFFKGRLGDMIKSGGANVTPSEVEQVLLAFPEIKEAYVVGVEDRDRGQTVEASRPTRFPETSSSMLTDHCPSPTPGRSTSGDSPHC